MIDQIAWKLIYLDTFDRETPARIEKQGNGLKSSLFCLWEYTLTEGISKKGNRSFSSFNLTFESNAAINIEAKKFGFSLNDNIINIWDNEKALSKLREYVFGCKDQVSRNIYIEAGEMLLNILVEYNYNKLTQQANKKIITSISKTSNDILNIVKNVSSQQELLEAFIK